jgi:hypothetical protein
MKTKNWIFGTIAVLVILLIAYYAVTQKQELTPVSEPTVVLQQSQSQSQGYDQSNESSQSSLETQTLVGLVINGEEYMQLRETVARLQAQLEACEGTSEVKKEQKTKAQSQGRESKIIKNETQTKPKPDVNSSTTTSTGSNVSSQSTDPQIAVTKYSGRIIGDFGVTFDSDSKLFYYVKKSLLDDVGETNRTITGSHLNGKTGAQGQVVGDYILYKTSRTVLVNMLNNTWKWAIYIGDHTQYGYDMWMPHELVKLTPELASRPDIEANGEGGFSFLLKMNYTSK